MVSYHIHWELAVYHSFSYLHLKLKTRQVNLVHNKYYVIFYKIEFGLYI